MYITTTNSKEQLVNKKNQSYRPVKSNNLTRYTSSAINDNSKPKSIVIFSASILKTLQMKKLNSLLNVGVTHLKFFPGSKAKKLSHHTLTILEE